MKRWMGMFAALLLCSCGTTDEARLENARAQERRHKPDKAYSAYRKLYEENGNAEAAFALGNLSLRETPEHPADPANAFFYYSAAAQKEHPGALFALGGMYEKGQGVSADRKKALELYCRSAASGHSDARLRASEICFSDPVLRDPAKGLQLLEKGSEQGDLRCKMRLASFCMGATDAARRDEKKARRLYEEMAQQNLPEARYFLAIGDYLGIGCEKNARKGLTEMRHAASSGSPEAWLFLSMLLDRRGRAEAAAKYREKAHAVFGVAAFAGVPHVSLWNSFEEMERAVSSAFRLIFPE